MAALIGPTLSRSLYVGTMIQIRGLASGSTARSGTGIGFLGARGSRARIPSLSPTLLVCSAATPPVAFRTHENAQRNRSIGLRYRVCWPLWSSRTGHPKTSRSWLPALRPLPELPPAPLHSDFRDPHSALPNQVPLRVLSSSAKIEDRCFFMLAGLPLSKTLRFNPLIGAAI